MWPGRLGRAAQVSGGSGRASWGYGRCIQRRSAQSKGPHAVRLWLGRLRAAVGHRTDLAPLGAVGPLNRHAAVGEAAGDGHAAKVHGEDATAHHARGVRPSVKWVGRVDRAAVDVDARDVGGVGSRHGGRGRLSPISGPRAGLGRYDDARSLLVEHLGLEAAAERLLQVRDARAGGLDERLGFLTHGRALAQLLGGACLLREELTQALRRVGVDGLLLHCHHLRAEAGLAGHGVRRAPLLPHGGGHALLRGPRARAEEGLVGVALLEDLLGALDGALDAARSPRLRLPQCRAPEPGQGPGSRLSGSERGTLGALWEAGGAAG